MGKMGDQLESAGLALNGGLCSDHHLAEVQANQLFEAEPFQASKSRNSVRDRILDWPQARQICRSLQRGEPCRQEVVRNLVARVPFRVLGEYRLSNGDDAVSFDSESSGDRRAASHRLLRS